MNSIPNSVRQSLKDKLAQARDYPWFHWIFGLACVSAGVAAFIWGGDLIHRNEQATNVIVTVFSILAGFLIAVMTLLGDQSLLPGSWKLGALHKGRIKAKMTRQKWLFCLYLTTLAIIFATTLLGTKHVEIVCWLERIYFGLATTAFALSFRLPWTLMAIQMDRLEGVIESRRNVTATIDKN